jgi:MFS family permease
VSTPPDRSYRALLAVPGLARVLAAMVLARVAAAMLSVALVLYALDEYDSPKVAGAAAFFSLFPGLVAAPVVGALLDRVGRLPLIRADYVVTAGALVAISILSFASALPAAAFLAIVCLFGVTYMFSDAGMRSLFPGMVPRDLWERVNAADSNGYLVAWILGPPLGAGLAGSFGGPVALLAVAVAFVLATVLLVGVTEPTRATAAGPGLAGQAVEGLRYVWSNPTLRGLGISVAVTNISWGVATLLVPVIVLDRLHAPPVVVGLAFTVSGVVGVASAFGFGRADTRGREWSLLVVAMAGVGMAAILLVPAVRSVSTEVGVAWVFASMAVLGFMSGLWDIALFTMRQRRTDPRLFGRAFAISMAFNQTGVPIGAGLAGWLAEDWIGIAAAVSIAAAFLGALLAAVLVPRTDTD